MSLRNTSDKTSNQIRAIWFARIAGITVAANKGGSYRRHTTAIKAIRDEIETTQDTLDISQQDDQRI